MITKTNFFNVLFCSLIILFAGSCKRDPIVNDDPRVQKIVVPEDFIIEHIYSPSENELGSWVSMAFDDKGRMITSDQYGGLFRIELPPIGSDSTVKPIIEKLDLPKPPGDTSSNVGIGFAQGLLYAYESLYVMINHRSNDKFGKGSGLYRLQDTDNDDQFDKITTLLELQGEGEHGPHSIVLGPDSAIYIVAGNHTDLPKMDAYRLPPTWQHDNLFPFIVDPQGHATDRKEPGGWIAKTDETGSRWELISAGYRNPYDIAFNDEGELFTYDSDMEWDFGMPWYRPTRINHVTSGSEYGWRTGNAKWDASYMDNLPAILNVGQGSPTNLLYAGNAKFPDKYRNSLLAFDWSFGIIYSVQLNPKGASYDAVAEEFVSGAPLPLTDGEIGPDGALYFVTGGRKLESDLYRVYHRDHADFKANTAKKLNKEGQLRKEIEQYHQPSPQGTVEKIWQHLGHEDRFIRYATRIAIEHQPVASWKHLVFQENDAVKLTEAMMALVRSSDKSIKDSVFQKLNSVEPKSVSTEILENLLRVYEVAIARYGQPAVAESSLLAERLNNLYPSNNNMLDRALSKILVSIDDPNVVTKTLPLIYEAKDDATQTNSFMSSSDLILRNPQYGLDIANMLANIPPAQQIYLATMLSTAKNGWSPESQDQYFKWFYKAFGYKGGNSYIGFIDQARQLALNNVDKANRKYFATLSGDSLLNEKGNRLAENVEGPKGPGRNWEIDTALKYIEQDKGVRNYKRGKELFIAIKCASCHTMKGEGGSIGPDLTQLATRFSKKDMLEAIIEPNKVISDQYESKVFTLKDGKTIMGRLKGETEKSYVISQNPYAPNLTQEIAKKDVKHIKVSEVSIMPPGSLNILSPDELNDIMAYLMSGGNENSEVYNKK